MLFQLLLTALLVMFRQLFQPLLTVKYTSNSLNTKKVLNYRTGAEGIESIVIDASTVSAGSDGRKVLNAGSLLVKITTPKTFGPYASGASDGRQTLAAPAADGPTVVILTQDIDVTDGNKPAAGYFAHCLFDSSELTLFGATASTVRSCFPTCQFM